jgi:hypothetical protein
MDKCQRISSKYFSVVCPVFCLHGVYLDGKHIIRSSLDLVVIAMDGNSWFRRSRSTSRFASQSENDSCWYVSAMSSAYWNWFDNVDGTSDKYRLNSNGTKILPWGNPLLCVRYLLLLSPRKTWKKRFGNILFSIVRQLGTRNDPHKFQHWAISPYGVCVNVCATACAVQLRFLRKPVCDMTQQRLHQSEVGFVEGSFARISWKRYWAVKLAKSAEDQNHLFQV